MSSTFTRLEKSIDLMSLKQDKKWSTTKEVIGDIFDTLSSCGVEKITVGLSDFCKTQLYYDHIVDRDFINQVQIDHYFEYDDLTREGVQYRHYNELYELISTKIIDLKTTEFIIEYQGQTSDYIGFRIRAHYPGGNIGILKDILPIGVKIGNIAFFDIVACKNQDNK